jgi:hypothetical protein
MALLIILIIIVLGMISSAIKKPIWQYLIIGAIILCCGSCTYGTYSIIKDTRVYSKDYKIHIEALKDNRDIGGQLHGGIFVSTGYIKEDLYYYYMINTVKGKSIGKISANKAYIKEISNDELPYIECGTYRFKNKNSIRDFYNLGNEDSFDWECTLGISKDAIDYQYKIDLQ